MKWIGQHIWSFISRFRSDVYLEDTSTGTIVSGGNLGLDSNNKIVKATISAGADESPTNGENLTHKYVKKTLSQLDMQALHTGTTAGGFVGKLVDAPGANLQIIPTDIWLFIDDAGTINNNAVNLVLGYGGTVLYQEALHLAKRFHYHTSGSHDSSYMMPRYLPEYASNITDGIDESLTLTLDGAIDTGSITEMQVHLTYYIINRS